MSFSFSFEDLDELDQDTALAFSTNSLQNLVISEECEATTSTLPNEEILLADLLKTLPPLISYTPVIIPLTNSKSSPRVLLRRDLFDARFQLISQDDSDDEEDLKILGKEGKGKGKEEFIVDETTDLVQGVYEGGLKTWECSLDLVDYLETIGYGLQGEKEMIRGKSVLEVGCGTSLPTCSLLARLLLEIQRNPSPPGFIPKPTVLHLQDYNKQVLTLITLPNLLLTYFLHLTPSAISTTEETAPGELEIDPSFLESFETLLVKENIEIKFYSGDWSTMNQSPNEKQYDIILTSETIYSLPSLPPLLNLLQSSSHSTLAEQVSLCLVACKRIYFGVGGGEGEFRRRVEDRGGKVSTVWGGEGEENSGVGRVVMSVTW